jgi:hypothetical protein
MSADNVTPISGGKAPSAPSKAERWPVSTQDKVTTAKCIVQAVLAADNSGAFPGDDDNYDLHYPLSMAIALLEEAAEAIGNSDDKQERDP